MVNTSMDELSSGMMGDLTISDPQKPTASTAVAIMQSGQVYMSYVKQSGLQVNHLVKNG